MNDDAEDAIESRNARPIDDKIWEPNLCPYCHCELTSLSIVRADAWTFDDVEGRYVRTENVDTDVYLACGECGSGLDQQDIRVENSPNWKEVKVDDRAV